MNPERPLVDVAVGMLCRSDGAVLMASRPAGKPYAGYWEFPGGKFEHSEDVAAALTRELQEELGIAVIQTEPAWEIEHDYPHARVRLLFCWVTEWEGQIKPLEQQQTLWVAPSAAWPYPVLPASIDFLPQIQRQAAQRADS